MSRLDAQLRFLLEIDRLKSVYRRSYLSDGSRKENSAEHSWHFAMAAVLLEEYAAEDGVDIFRTVKLALVHDIVEIDAGDTYVYDLAAQATRLERERSAATRLFGLLPEEQGAEFRSLWEEYEAGETREAQFAAVLDRLCPVILNYHQEGRAWREHGVTARQVRERNLPGMEAAPEIRDWVARLIDEAVERRYLAEG